MPWEKTTIMDQRTDFIRDWQRQGNVACLCRAYGISRVTGHKWIERFQEEGRPGLADRSRRPHHSPGATPVHVCEALVALRRQHPTWGAKKLVVLLERSHPRWPIPAPSTASEILSRAGLVHSVTRRRCLGSSPVPGGCGEAANEVWCVDFKGEFKLGNGAYCYPLTVSDEHSRYLLECHGMAQIRGQEVQERFERLFRDHGLPQRIRSDNGSPFAGTGAARLSRLSVWWLQLGITLDRNQPHHPEQNGRHERIHRDLKAFATRPPERTMSAQQKRLDRFRHLHNQERPHEALGLTPPAEHYKRSPREYPSKLPEVSYPGHYEVRLVDASGMIKLKGRPVFISSALAGQPIGLVESDDGIWKASFSTLSLGIYDERRHCFHPTAGGATERA
jgi:transposase InsO family protein